MLRDHRVRRAYRELQVSLRLGWEEVAWAVHHDLEHLLEVLPDYTQLQEARHTLEHGTFAEQREVADRILEGRL